jgi:hypothetical protein
MVSLQILTIVSVVLANSGTLRRMDAWHILANSIGQMMITRCFFVPQDETSADISINSTATMTSVVAICGGLIVANFGDIVGLNNSEHVTTTTMRALKLVAAVGVGIYYCLLQLGACVGCHIWCARLSLSVCLIGIVNSLLHLFKQQLERKDSSLQCLLYFLVLLQLTVTPDLRHWPAILAFGLLVVNHTVQRNTELSVGAARTPTEQHDASDPTTKGLIGRIFRVLLPAIVPRTKKAAINPQHFRVLSCFTSMCSLLYIGRNCYFGTGHRFEFNSLQLAAGFVGANQFYFYYAGALVFFNTTAHEIITIIGVYRIDLLLSRRQDSEEPTLQHGIMMELYLLIRLLLLLCACVCGFIHRRHLMVWAIFVPKIIFEGAFWLVSGTITTITLLLCHDHDT